MQYKNTKLWFLYNILKENKKKNPQIHHMINEYCQQIAFSLYIVVSYDFFVSLRQLIVYQVDFDTIISRLIEKWNWKTHRIQRHSWNRWLPKRDAQYESKTTEKGCVIVYYYKTLGLLNPRLKLFDL